MTGGATSFRRLVALRRRNIDSSVLLEPRTVVRLMHWSLQCRGAVAGAGLLPVAESDPSLCAWLVDRFIPDASLLQDTHPDLASTTRPIGEDHHWYQLLREINQHEARSLIQGLLQSVAIPVVDSANVTHWQAAQRFARHITNQLAKADTSTDGADAAVWYAASLLAPRGTILPDGTWKFDGQTRPPPPQKDSPSRLQQRFQETIVRDSPVDSPVSGLTEEGDDVARMFPDFLQWVETGYRLELDFCDTLERQKLAAMKELAYGASHEINNPLANISTRAQMLMRNETDPERRRTLATITSQAFRAHEMIADMMLFAKPPEPQLERVGLEDFVRSVTARLQSQLPAGIEVRTLWAAPDAYVSIDTAQLTEALSAIWRNALEAMGDSGQLTITTRTESASSSDVRCVEVCLADTGPGIRPEVRRHLFDPFFSGREAGRGLGFGLSKAWRIVQQHHGTLRVASDEGTGATLVIQLPQA